MKIRIEPYKKWSGGAKALGKRCGILRATAKQVAKHGDFDTIINWGNSEGAFNGDYINKPEAVGIACNKHSTAERFADFEIPQAVYTTNRETAKEWWEEGKTIVCRTLLRAQGGRGIVLASKELEVDVVEAPLYTEYFKKADEYRVHVFADRVIDAQQKLKRQEVTNEEVNYQIRNSANGWVYCRGGVVVPECVAAAAVRAVSCLGLDFGAADIGFNRHRNECAVFEVNTAPGLEGTTLDKYYEAFLQVLPIARGMYAKRRAIA